MINIEGTTITMTRGDTLRIFIELKRDNEIYTPVSGDEVRFALKRPIFNAKRTEYKEEFPLLYKVIPNDTMVLELEPEDTKSLGFGEYVYDLQITFSDGTVDTFISTATLKLTPEVD